MCGPSVQIIFAADHMVDGVTATTFFWPMAYWWEAENTLPWSGYTAPPGGFATLFGRTDRPSFFGTHEGTLAQPGLFTGLSGIWLALLDDHSSWVAMSKLISSGLCLLSDLLLFWLDSHAPWFHPMCLNRLVSAYLSQARQFKLPAWSCSGGGQCCSWWCQDPWSFVWSPLGSYFWDLVAAFIINTLGCLIRVWAITIRWNCVPETMNVFSSSCKS